MHRVEAGLKILSEKKSEKLFISGVYDATKLKEILVFSDKDIYELLFQHPQIELGRQAQTTEENAIETYEWIIKNNIKSIRLVTSNYHMPRSLFEFRKLLPNIEIIANPVFTKNFQKYNLWKHFLTFKLFIKEYIKFSYIFVEYYLKKIINVFY